MYVRVLVYVFDFIAVIKLTVFLHIRDQAFRFACGRQTSPGVVVGVRKRDRETESETEKKRREGCALLAGGGQPLLALPAQVQGHVRHALLLLATP